MINIKKTQRMVHEFFALTAAAYRQNPPAAFFIFLSGLIKDFKLHYSRKAPSSFANDFVLLSPNILFTQKRLNSLFILKVINRFCC
jgi:hypothetical protein